VFPSSIAVFGGLLPDQVDDDHLQRPQTSYGTHKAIAELMLADATRHGVIDARALRLPIVLVHPGPPTQSVSDRIAGMVRDSVARQPSTCPLRPDAKVAVVSVQTVVQNLITLHNADPTKLRGKRMLNQPALTVSMTDIVESIARVTDGTPEIGFVPDAELKRIVDGWPKGFISTRAPSVGVVADKTFDDIVLNYLATLVPGKSAA
jgi:nucleoside-diphosphate-sugar epimerase